VVNKENQSVDAMEYMGSTDYLDYIGYVAEDGSRTDGPTVTSVAAARAAQARERAAFTRATGIRVSANGHMLR
jgi:uncharacterized membrane protein